MSLDHPQPVLKGAKALVTGIANEHSIAYGCAKAFRELGAELAITYADEKAKPYVEPLATGLDAPIFMPLDASSQEELEAVFRRITSEWNHLDIMVHSIAWAPKADLQGGLLNSSSEGFGAAMDISCHSFVRMARLAAPLMKNGGSMFTMSYHGANKVVPNYNLMGPVKAALEACARYLAYELGPQGIRVHAISPGPLKTRAASGLKDFDLLLTEAAERAPLGELVDIMDVGAPVPFSRRRMRDVSRARRYMSTEGYTSWGDSPDRIRRKRQGQDGRRASRLLATRRCWTRFSPAADGRCVRHLLSFGRWFGVLFDPGRPCSAERCFLTREPSGGLCAECPASAWSLQRRFE